MWLHPETLAVYPTHAAIRAAWPQTSFPTHLTDAVLAELGLVPVLPAPQPAYDPLTQDREELPPAGVNGIWTQQWRVVAASPADVAARLARWRGQLTVTPRQARLALQQAGLITAVTAWIAAADEATRIEWEFALEVRRDWPPITACAAALGLTDEQLDELFTLAATR